MFKNKAIKNLYSLTLSEISTKGIGFLINIYLARILDVDGYGTLTNINSILLLAINFINLGFQMLGMRSIATDYANREKYVNNIISIKLILCVLTYIFVICFVLLKGYNELYSLAIIIGTTQFIAVSIFIDWFYMGIERMEILGLRSVLMNVITLLGVILFVRSKKDIPLYIGIVSVSSLINNGWLIFLYIKKYARIKLKLTFNIEIWKSLLKQSITLGFTAIIIGFMTTFNVYLLTEMKNDYETGLFGATFKLLGIFVMPVYIVLNTFSPQFAKDISIDKKINTLNKSMKMTMFVGTFISIIVLTNAEFIIYIIFGKNFITADANLIIFMVDLFFVTIQLNYFTLFNVWKKEKLVMKVFLVTLLINIISNFILINLYGSIGATIAILITDITSLIIFAKLMKNYLNTFGLKNILLQTAIFILNITIILFINNFLSINEIIRCIINISLTIAIYLWSSLKFKIVAKEDLKRIINI